MADFKETFEEINELRFGKLIQYADPQNQSYTYDDETKRYIRSDTPTAVCQECEDNSANKSSDGEFSLQIVSHGIHSLDLFKIQKFNDYSDYRDDAVMLVMESPASNLDACYKEEIDGKHPAKVWWWADGKSTDDHKSTDERTTYPYGFSSKKYGEFFNSFVHTFKLKNAYMTNLVKCGMLKDSDHNKYGNLDEFPDKCISMCFKEFFLKEVEILKPKVIFTLSSKVYNYLNVGKVIEKIEKKLGAKPYIVALTHPARCRQGFTNEFYRTLWYCRTLEGMINAGIITDKEEQHKYWDKYVEDYKNWKEDKK